MTLTSIPNPSTSNSSQIHVAFDFPGDSRGRGAGGRRGQGQARTGESGNEHRDEDESTAHRPQTYAGLAVPIIDDYDGFLVDLDGVVWLGRDPIPGSPEALATMLAAGKEVVFVTNNPTQTARGVRRAAAGTRASRSGRSGSSPPGSSSPRLAAEAAGPGGGALVLGREPLRELVAGDGLRLVDFETPDRGGRGRRLRLARTSPTTTCCAAQAGARRRAPR